MDSCHLCKGRICACAGALIKLKKCELTVDCRTCEGEGWKKALFAGWVVCTDCAQTGKKCRFCPHHPKGPKKNRPKL